MLGLVTNTEYFIDLGFPIVVSRQVYDKINAARTSRNAVQIEGIVRLRTTERSNAFSAYIAASGAQEDAALRSLLQDVIGIESVVGYIGSPLDISVRSHSSHPCGTLRVDGPNIAPVTVAEGVHFLVRNVVDNPEVLPNVFTGSQYLIGEDYQHGTSLEPVTDFDARLRRFRSAVPSSINPAILPSAVDEIERTCRSGVRD
jgi:hypothetical protein